MQQRRAGAVQIFDRAFAGLLGDPDQEQRLVSHLGTSIDQLGSRRGGCTAIAESGDGALLGFAFGHGFDPGQWWPRLIALALDDAGLSAWHRDAFELLEIHVDPDWQGQGIGTALLGEICARCDASTVLLGTSAAHSNRAAGWYARAGFIDLLPGFTYPNGTPGRIMGARTTTIAGGQ